MQVSRGIVGSLVGILLAAIACAHVSHDAVPGTAEPAGECKPPTCHPCTTHDECRGKGSNGADWSCNDGRCDYPSRGVFGSSCGARFDCSQGLACIDEHCTPCQSDQQCRPGMCNPQHRCEAKACATNDDCGARDEICAEGICWILYG